MPGFEGCFTYRIAGGTVVAGKFDNQDTVLCGEGYQQDNPDLRVDADGHSHNETTENGSQQGDRQSHDGCQRTCPTFILCRKNQEGHQ